MSTFFECDTIDSNDVTNKVKVNSCLKTEKQTETEMWVFLIKRDRGKLQRIKNKW